MGGSAGTLKAGGDGVKARGDGVKARGDGVKARGDSVKARGDGGRPQLGIRREALLQGSRQSGGLLLECRSLGGRRQPLARRWC